MSESKRASIERLLTHRDFVRRLARTLARDVQAADDAEQQTWLAALRHLPADLRAPRAWLATILRRTLARSAHREARRRGVEQLASPGSDVVVTSQAQLLAQRHLVEAVLELDELYRTTLWMRFFEERSPREIAGRLGVSVETVKTRQKRALAILRRRLDRSDYWPAIALLGRRELQAPGSMSGHRLARATSSFTSGALIMSQGKVVASLIVLLIAIAAITWLGRTDSSLEPVRPSSSGPESTVKSFSDTSRRVPSGRLPNGAERTGEVTGELEEPKPEGLPRFLLEVIDTSGQPIPGATARLLETGELGNRDAVADDRGRVELKAPGGIARELEIDHPRFARLRTPAILPGPLTRTVVLEPGGRVDVQLVGDVTSFEGAVVQLSSRIPNEGSRVEMRQRSDASGFVSFESVPIAEPLFVVALGPFRSPDTVGSVVMNVDTPVRVDLLVEPAFVVRGHVIESESAFPVRGAHVRPSFSADFVETDSLGEFRLHCSPTRVLVITHPFFVDRWHILEPGEAEAPVELRLQKRGEPVIVRLVDDEDRPLPGAVFEMRANKRVSFRSWSRIADERGEIDLSDLPTDLRVGAWAHAPGYRSRPSLWDRETRKVMLTPVRSIDVRVRDLEGNPVAGAIVLASPQQAPQAPGEPWDNIPGWWAGLQSATISSSDGVARLNLHRGTHFSVDLASQVWSGEKAPWVGPDDSNAIELTAVPAVRLYGTVTHNGVRLASAWADIEDGPGCTIYEGFFSFRVPRDRSYTLTIRHSDADPPRSRIFRGLRPEDSPHDLNVIE